MHSKHCQKHEGIQKEGLFIVINLFSKGYILNISTPFFSLMNNTLSFVWHVSGAPSSATPSRESPQTNQQTRSIPPSIHASLGGLKLSKAASTSSTEKSSGSFHGNPSFFRTLSEPVTKDSAIIANIPKLELLAAVNRSSGAAGVPKDDEEDSSAGDDSCKAISSAGFGNLEDVMPIAEAHQAEPNMPSTAESSDTLVVPASVQPGATSMSVPVVLAQPVFVNSQIQSIAYKPIISVNMLAQSRRWAEGINNEAMQLGTVVIAGSKITLPAIPLSCLLNSNFFPPFSSIPSEGTLLPNHEQKDHPSPSISQTVAASFNDTFSGTDKQDVESEGVDENLEVFGKGKDQRDISTLSRQMSLKEVQEGNEKNLTTSPGRQAVSATAIPYHLQGHSVPTLHTSTCVTFCCVKRAQPMYVQVRGSNRRVSMYSNWRLSKHNPNPVGLTSRMLLSLYCSRYTSNPTYSTCAMLQNSVTHSSYWRYHHGNSCKQEVAMTPSVSMQPTSVLSSDSSEGAASSQDVEIVSSCSGEKQDVAHWTAFFCKMRYSEFYWLMIMVRRKG